MTRPAATDVGPLPPFVNEPLAELRRPAVRAACRQAVAELDAGGPIAVCSLVDGRPLAGGALVRSTDPGQPARVIAEHRLAGPEDVVAALAAARRAAEDWSRRPAIDRVGIVVRAASLMRARRLTLAALIVRECAKPWVDADAEVAEAIDFLEYYARRALVLAGGRELISPPGERNSLAYAARGVAAVIGPWNFPLAIPAGMTVAALVTGNTVVLKPAEQSPACGACTRLDPSRGGRPGRRARAPARRRRGRPGAGRRRRRDDRLHRVAGGRAGDPQTGGERRAGSAPPDTSRRRAGRQELRDRRRGR